MGQQTLQTYISNEQRLDLNNELCEVMCYSNARH